MKVNQIPSIVLILLGSYIGATNAAKYLTIINTDISHELGIAKLITLVIVLISVALVGLGIWAFRRERPSISISILVGLLVLRLTFVIELYSFQGDSAIIYGLAIVSIIGSGIASYVTLTRTFLAETRFIQGTS